MKKSFYSVLAILSLLSIVAGPVAMAANKNALNCPGGNAPAPAPQAPAAKAPAPNIPANAKYTPPPVSAPWVENGVWTYDALNKIGYLAQLAQWGLWEDLDGDGDYTVLKGAEKVFNKYGMDGQCFSSYTWNDGDCIAGDAYFNMAHTYYPASIYTDPVERADLAIADWYAYNNWKLTVVLPENVYPTVKCYKLGICEPYVPVW